MDIVNLKIDSFSYGTGNREIESLKGQELSMKKGEKLSIIGPSGCGKSTLLKIISGMEKLEKGSVKVYGKISYILQEYGLFPWKKVYHNIELPLISGNKKENREVRKQKVEKIAESLGIGHILSEYPSNISGGQKQRVAIARALITEPDILLMDEPFNALDSLTREDIQDMVLRLTEERKTAVIIVTHNIEESVYMSDKVLLMSATEKNRMINIDRESENFFEFRNSDLYYHQVNTVRRNLKEMSGGGYYEK